MALWDLAGAYRQNQKTPLISCQFTIDYDILPISFDIRYIAIRKTGDAPGYKTSYPSLALLCFTRMSRSCRFAMHCFVSKSGRFAKLYVTLKAWKSMSGRLPMFASKCLGFAVVELLNALWKCHWSFGCFEADQLGEGKGELSKRQCAEREAVISYWHPDQAMQILCRSGRYA